MIFTTPKEAHAHIKGLDRESKQDVWGTFPDRYDDWDAFDAFLTIAKMRWEYIVQEDFGYWRDVGFPFDDLAEAQDFLEMEREDAPMRIVRRLVSTEEVVE